MKVINCTKATVSVYTLDGIIDIPLSANVARSYAHSGEPEMVETELGVIPISTSGPPKPVGLPEPEDGVLCVVPTFVMETSSRSDLVAPDGAPESAVKNHNNQLIGVRRLRRRGPCKVKAILTEALCKARSEADWASYVASALSAL